MNEIKVLHLLQSSRFSGAENVVIQIIDMFRNDKFDMAYCSRDGQIQDELNERNIKFLPLKKFNISEVKRAIEEYNPDIIHAHDAYASFIATIVGKNESIISHMHGNHEDLRKLGVKSILYLICSKRIKHIFWVSDSAFNNFIFKKYVSSKSSVLYNVINFKKLKDKMSKDSRKYYYDIVYVGRITYPKNPERLISILKKVINIKPDTKAGIVGTGDLFERTKELTFKLGISNNVEFLGFTDNPTKILHDAKVMVMTSRYEGTPMSALEAMCLGVPIVSTPTDGLKDLIINDYTGYLSDNDEELVNKIISILNDNELRNKLSKNAYRRFDEINTIDKYKTTIKDIYN